MLIPTLLPCAPCFGGRTVFQHGFGQVWAGDCQGSIGVVGLHRSGQEKKAFLDVQHPAVESLLTIAKECKFP